MRLRTEAVDMIKEICSRYKNEPSPLMLVLIDVQKEYGSPKDHKPYIQLIIRIEKNIQIN